jgi:hypothetical protein
MGRLLLCGFESKLGRGEFARLNRMGHRCSNGIQIDIRRARQDRFLVQQSDRFETALEEFPNLLVFFVRTHGDFLAQYTHPPRNIAQTQTNGLQRYGVAAYGLDFGFVWFESIPALVLSFRTNHEPTTSDFAIVPSVYDVGSGSQNQVDVIGHDG